MPKDDPPKAAKAGDAEKAQKWFWERVWDATNISFLAGFLCFVIPGGVSKCITQFIVGFVEIVVFYLGLE